MILAGRVAVNGEVITQLGSQADPEVDRIAFDGKSIKTQVSKVYYLFNKPEHVMVTRYDPEGRPTVYDYLKGISERVNTVGRLDFDSEGLLLLTNDGELHARLTHPRHEVPKTYHVKIDGNLTAVQCKMLESGINIGDYVTRPCKVKVINQTAYNQWIEMTITEGKNRQVRKMMEALGYEVVRLVRVGIGPLRIADLQKGTWRKLTLPEVRALQTLESAASSVGGSRRRST